MKIKHKLTGFILAFALSVTVLFYLIGSWDLNKYSVEDTRTHILDARANFNSLEKGDTKKLLAALEVLVQDPGLKAVYLKKDRDELYRYGQKLFLNLKESSGITHFYFILPDGHVFLRMHDKGLYGDQVKRISFETAKNSQKPAWGIELGKTAFALRAVMPYVKDGRLIGYVELGEEIDHFLKMLRGESNNEFGIIADKKHLNRDDWRSMRQASGLRDNWDDFEKHVLLGSTDKGEIAPKCLVEGDIEHDETGGDIYSRMRHKDENYLCGGFGLHDNAGRHVGAVLTAMDITGHIAFSKSVKNHTLLAAMILFFTCVSAGALVSRSIAAPILELSGLVEAVGRGDLSQRAVDTGADEIGQLGRAFNDMVERRRRNEEELIRHREHLDELVQGRTSELERANLELDKIFSAIEQSDESIVITDINGTIQYVNPAFTRRTGYSREEAIGCNPRILNSGQTPKKIFDDLWGTITSGRPWKGALINKKKSGELYYEEASIAPVFDAQGNITNFVAVKADVTARIMAEKELQNKNYELTMARDAAEASSRAKSGFLATMSHELKTPLNAIIGFSEVLEEGIAGPLADNQKDLVKDICSSGRHLLSLINDILDLSKVDVGKMELELSGFNLEELIDGTLVMFKEKAMKHALKITTEVDEGIGEIIADERKIKQILFNLMSNAVKFTPDGGSVSVQARKVTNCRGAMLAPNLPNSPDQGVCNTPLQNDDDFIEISVTDTGIGISAEDLKRLFHPFQQVESEYTRKYSGIGLGLSLCKKFVELHGGEIRVESELGKGSKFAFVIPVTDRGQ